ncbi:alpha/beta fold hydrolase [Micromonospora sp. NPDC047548]|uniref:alpha/beta fold hydrolase n=1 Tax=Micromonospora sp. NPDC047548 TaxID=3155624 RepID=UPI0033E0699D
MTDKPLIPGEHVILVDRRAQRYHVAGNGPVCIVHPGGPGIGWEHLRMPALEERLTLVYLEPIGTGQSARFDKADDYTIDRYSDYLAQVVDHLAVPAPLLLGHSHGGFVAQQYALRHPGRLGGLVLYATSPVTGIDFWNAAVANVQRFPHRFPDQPDAADIPHAFAAALAAGSDATYTEALRRLLPIYLARPWLNPDLLRAMQDGLHAWVAPARAQEPPFDVRNQLDSLRVPTLILAGAHDFICGPTWAQMLVDAIPDAELVTFADSGHMVHLEEVEPFALSVADFAAAAGITTWRLPDQSSPASDVHPGQPRQRRLLEPRS